MENNKKIFIGKLQGGDGGFLAVSKTEPIFCIQRPTEKALKQAVLEFLEFYCEYKGEATKLQIKKQKKIGSLSLGRRYFSPSSAITVEAC